MGPEEIPVNEQVGLCRLLLSHRGNYRRGSPSAVRPDQRKHLSDRSDGEARKSRHNHSTGLSHSHIQRDGEQTRDQLHTEHRGKSQESWRKTDPHTLHRKRPPRTLPQSGKSSGRSRGAENGGGGTDAPKISTCPKDGPTSHNTSARTVRRHRRPWHITQTLKNRLTFEKIRTLTSSPKELAAAIRISRPMPFPIGRPIYLALDRPQSQVDGASDGERSEEHTSELQSRLHLVCRLLLEKKKTSLVSAVFINRVLASRLPTLCDAAILTMRNSTFNLTISTVTWNSDYTTSMLPISPTDRR